LGAKFVKKVDFIRQISTTAQIRNRVSQAANKPFVQKVAILGAGLCAVRIFDKRWSGRGYAVFSGRGRNVMARGKKLFYQ
jgi:hypothetical protein